MLSFLSIAALLVSIAIGTVHSMDGVGGTTGGKNPPTNVVTPMDGVGGTTGGLH